MPRYCTAEQLYRLFLKYFKYQPTKGQEVLLNKLSHFVLYPDQRALFVMKGYAGTGKTSVVRALVGSLEEIFLRVVLLAPTGRAAKVLSNYTGRKALTIHKLLYRIASDKEGNVRIQLQQNLFKNTVFVIDEASMISSRFVSSGNDYFRSRSLLDDIFEYVYNGNNCRLILIGDSAQLPPVGSALSPALDMDYLKASYDVKAGSFELTEVVRQEENSGILENATSVRNSIEKVEKKILPVLKPFPKDVRRINMVEFEDALNEAYSGYGPEDTMFICQTNKRANLFNAQIRVRIFGREGEINAGDYLMVVKNNYFWLPETSQAGFIANGEIIEVLRIRKVVELYGFRFAEASVRMIDYPDENELEVMLLLDTLTSDGPSLSEEDSRKLYEQISEDYAGDFAGKKLVQKIRETSYFNALQVKFAYAVTCHKAQGGQWKAVFAEQGYVSDKISMHEYYRWLYTAITRASEKLWLVNFEEDFFLEKIKN